MTEKNDADSGDSDPTQRWQTLKDLFSEALEATPEEREAVLVRGAAGDAQLLAEVRGLLDASFAIAALESTGRALPFLWGSFEVRERIGSGAFGEVFRAFDPVLRREVALKLRLADVRRGFLQDARADLEFGDTLEEARRLARIRHPNVLPVLGVELHDGEIGIWTDLVQGETLEQELARTGVFSATSIARVGSDLAHALEAVHGAGIVHGDVKTSNAMQDRDGRVILMDLGASRSSLPAASDDEDRLQGSDDVGVRGTPSAMAPELFEGAVPCVATDLYALGVLLYRLATGRYPFQGHTLEELRAALAERRYVPLEEIRPDLPMALARLLHRSLALDPAERPSSAREFGWLLAACVGIAPESSAGEMADGKGEREAGAEDLGGAESSQRNLPHAGPRFIGRLRELAQLRALLSSAGLVTIVGTGGVGKTRIALQIAHELARALPGAFWVDLTGITNPSLVPGAIGRSVGFPDEPDRDPTDLLVSRLAEQPALLVFDNAEHLRDSIAAVAQAILPRCPRLHILVTSRHRLGLPEERLFRLAPMSLPELRSNARVVDGLESDAVRLFLDRAGRSAGELLPTNANLEVIERIVRHLDGLPLALELAAARAGRLGLVDLSSRIESNLGLLARPPRDVEEIAPVRTGEGGPARPQDFGAHQRTVLDSIAWSYGLLEEEESLLFRRLSVFAGGWSLEAAESICADGASGRVGRRELIDVLSALVEHSLVQLSEAPGLPARYRFLETVRKFARGMLDQDLPGLQAARFEWVHGYVKHQSSGLHGKNGPDHLRALDTEYPNLLESLAWAWDDDPDLVEGQQRRERAAEACTWLGPYWFYRGFFREGLTVTLDALSRLDTGPFMVRCASQASIFASRLGELTRAEALAEEAVETARRLGDEDVLAPALGTLFPLRMHWGHLDRAQELLDEAIEIRRRKPHAGHLVALLGNAAALASQKGDLEAARAHYEEAIAEARRLNDEFSLGPLLGHLAYTDRMRGDFASCRTLASESLKVVQRANDHGNLWIALLELCWVAVEEGDVSEARKRSLELLAATHRAGQHGPFLQATHVAAEILWNEGRHDDAVRLLGFISAEAKATRWEFSELDRAKIETLHQVARGSLDEARYLASWAEGRTLSKDHVLARIERGL